MEYLKEEGEGLCSSPRWGPPAAMLLRPPAKECLGEQGASGGLRLGGDMLG